MNRKYLSDSRQPNPQTVLTNPNTNPNSVGGHRGANFVGGHRAGPEADSTTLTYVDTGITTTVTPVTATPRANAPAPTFFEQYKKPLLIGGGILLLSGLAYVTLKK